MHLLHLFHSSPSFLLSSADICLSTPFPHPSFCNHPLFHIGCCFPADVVWRSFQETTDLRHVSVSVVNGFNENWCSSDSTVLNIEMQGIAYVWCTNGGWRPSAKVIHSSCTVLLPSWLFYGQDWEMESHHGLYSLQSAVVCYLLNVL